MTQKGDRVEYLVERTGESTENTQKSFYNDAFSANAAGEIAEKIELRPVPQDKQVQTPGYKQEWLASGAHQETIDLKVFRPLDSHSPAGGAA